jgi:eukaryotic-like serine/threonine-protein kinase
MSKQLSPNSTLSHYRIVAKIGEGGMGEVFLAEDTRLRRRVALKVLPEEVAADVDRLLRFEREAFAASALNHPNILTIFEFGAENGTHFLAAEFVDGESLRERMSRSTMTLTETLEIVIQIASALQAAHGAGIIHRDIKPDNVMIRADGYVKVLDFGLAKLSEPGAVATGFSSDPEAQTRMQLQTQAGIIMGTVAYMSPEQARGHEVDTRTDIWSLGCVLYEMLTRQQPFRGETTADALANIIHREPVSIVNLRQDANAELERIITRTLSKNRDERYQTANVLLADLKQLQKRLEFEAELERSSAPSLNTEARTQVIRSATTGQAMRNSIAVLPFSNLSADADNDYFCDGLAEELLGALSKIDDLRVAARSSAFSFKGRNTNVGEIGRTLSVKTVLEGSIRKSGDRVRISVQLVNAADGYHLWSERYDSEMKDIFDVQDEITLSVVDALKLKLLGDEKEEVFKRYTQNAEAYQLYLRGRFFFLQRTPEAFKKAIEYFQQAIQLDAEYALAYSGLADCYTFLGFYEHLAPAEAERNLKGPAFKSLELDDTLAETRTSVALYKSLYQWDFVEADKEHKRAIALNPKYAFAHHLDSATVVLLGRNDEAIAAETRAVELEPFTAIFNASLGWWFYLAHLNEEAIAQSLRTIEIAPNHFFAYWVLGLAYGLAGKYDDAIAALKKGVSLTNTQYIKADLARIYAQGSRRDEALAVLSELRHEAEEHYVSAVNVAKIYLGLGEIEQVYEQLEKAVAERAVRLPWLMVDPMLDQLRAKPRFRDLWRRIGLPQNETAQRTPTEASEGHTVIFDSAERRGGKAVSAESSGQSTDTNSPADPESRGGEELAGSYVEGGDLSPLSYVATRRDDAGDKSPASKAPTSRRTPHATRPLRSKSILIIGLTICLVAVAVAAYFFFRNGSSVQIEAIAVMPFVNESGNQDIEYLSDGMTETLMSSLSQLPNMNVKARSLVFRYKGKDTDARTIGKELNVQAVLNGRIVQHGDGLTLYLELVDTGTGNRIWGDQYNRKQADLVSLQTEIALDVSQKLRTKLSGADEKKLTKKYTENAEAYQLYLKGRFFVNRRTAESLRKAIEYFDQAISIDPNYALGYAGLADSYLLLGIPDAITGALSPQDSLPKARAAAEKALQIDNSVGEIYASLAHVKWKEWNWAGAEADFDRGAKLSPNYPIGHLYHAVYLSSRGRQGEAVQEIRRAQELDPLSLPINASVVYVLYLGRQYDEAIAAAKKTLEMDAVFPLTHQRLGMAYVQKKMYKEAIAEFLQAANYSNRAPLAITSLGHAFAASGNQVESQRVLAELKELSHRRYVSPYGIAMIYAALGDKEQAFQWLERANEERNTELVFLRVDPRVDPLRDDPRFQELVKGVGIPY